jgi:hypothetical protein
MRQVVTHKNISRVKAKLPEEEKEKVKPDKLQELILKYIPAEVVTLYILVYGIAKAAENEIPFELISWVLVGVGIIGTILYLWRIAKVDWLQILISTVAFAVWVFAMGHAFSQLSWYNQVYGALMLPIYTFFIPIIIGK